MPATLEAKPSIIPRAERLYTGEDLLRHPEWGPCELIRGKVVRMCRPNHEHGVLAGFVVTSLNIFVMPRKLGVVATCDSGIYLERDPDTVRGPDAYFISAARRPKTIDKKASYLEVSPELCVEIVSPQDRWSKIVLKVDSFLTAGVQLIWVIDPKTRKAHIFRADGSTAMIGADGVLSGETVLPGFELYLRDLFAVLD